jgi:fluoroacetyl-CoA thioesterase
VPQPSERSEEFTVDDRLLTDVGGTLGARVLSTPGMIAMMERTAAMLAAEALDDGRPTVGFEVCVRHVAAASEGARCVATARLREIEDGRKLRFDVEVREDERVIGTGTHERRAVAPRGDDRATMPEPPGEAGAAAPGKTDGDEGAAAPGKTDGDEGAAAPGKPADEGAAAAGDSDDDRSQAA